jgi:hypothetical protein
MNLSDQMLLDTDSDPKPAKPKPQVQLAPPVKASLSSAMAEDAVAPVTETKEPAKPKDYTPDNTTTPEVATHIATGIGSSIIGGWRGLVTLATGGTLDDAANAVREEQEKRTYQPQSEESKKVVETIGSPANPLNWPAIASKKAGEFAQDVGAPPSVATGVEMAGNVVAPWALGKGLKLVGSGSMAAETAPTVRVEPTLSNQSARTQALADWTDAAKAHELAVKDKSIPIAEVQRLGRVVDAAEAKFRALPMIEAKAAGEQRVQPNIANAQIEPAAGTARDRFTTPAELGEETPKFLEEAPEAGPPGGPEYKSRAGILRRVGVTDARESQLTGDLKESGTDFQLSKVDSSAGDHLAKVFADQKAQLENYSEGLVRDTGGTLGAKDQSTLYGRGDTILRPMEGLNDYFNKETSRLYKEADARAAGTPTKLDNFKEVLGDASRLTNSDNVHLQGGVQSYLKKLGIDANQGMTVSQAETVRKYLNENWSPQNSRFTAALKNAIDDDVLQGAGEDIYKQARAMRAMKGGIFENDLDLGNGRTLGNGIKKLFDANGKGVELKGGATPEKIPDIVTSLPPDQFAHVIKTLKSLPQELQPQGEAALSEIKAQFANKIHDLGSAQAGQWAAKNVSKYLNQNSARMQQIFTPEEMVKFNDLNDAGHILAKPQSYPGAAVQSENLLRRGALGTIKAAGGLVGGTVGTVVGAPRAGAAVGSALTGSVIDKMGEAAALKNTMKRTVRLSDIPE